MAKPTVHDIAREAGVSLATVDRVMNARPGVKARTVQRVQAAIETLGYVRDLSAANLARGRDYRFAFLLPDADSQFLHQLRAAIEEAGAAARFDRCFVEIIPLEPTQSGCTQAFDQIEDKDMDGVAVMAPVCDPVADLLKQLDAAGQAVVTLVTDQAGDGRGRFVGIDNMAAGRTAGRIMAGFLKVDGPVAMVVNTMQARDMVERLAGFTEVLQSERPGVSLLPPLEGHDDRAKTRELLAAALHQDPAGVYSAGAGTRGVTSALQHHDGPSRPIVIAHDLTSHTKAALRDGIIDVVIDQNTGHLARSALRVLRAKIENRDLIPSQERIRIEVVLKENLT